MGCRNGCSGSCSNAVFVGDWIEGVLPARDAPPLVEVRFKGNRRELFWTALDPPLTVGEWVVVPELIRRSAEAPLQIGRGYDIGCVQLTGHLAEARRKAQRQSIDPQQRILRRATAEEQQRLLELRLQELTLLQKVRHLVAELGLDQQHEMKVTDVECTADGRTIFCYFTANGRVDFRALIRRIAETLNMRPEMRQVAAREETARIGGIGTCGRELCCSSWLTSLPTVPAQEVTRYQGISLNTTKVLGLCGRLKCCLSYELDAYKKALSRIPSVKSLHTQDGDWKYLRTEILLERLWFEKVGEGKQVCLLAQEVCLLLEMNRRGERPPSIEPYMVKFPDLPTRI